MSRHSDDPEYRKLMDEVIAWLADGRELAQLEKLVKDIKAQPRKRSSTVYKVKSSDGSVIRPLARSKVRTNAPSRRQIRVVGVPRNPILKLVAYLREHGELEAPAPRKRSSDEPSQPKSR